MAPGFECALLQRRLQLRPGRVDRYRSPLLYGQKKKEGNVASPCGAPRIRRGGEDNGLNPGGQAERKRGE